MTDKFLYESMADITRVQARKNGDIPALIFEGRETTYAQLDVIASKIANGLSAEGLKVNSRVAYIGKNTDLFFQMITGTAKAAMVAVGVNWRLAPPELVYIFENSSAEIVIVGPEFYELIGGIEDQLTQVKKFIALEGGHDRWTSFADWLEPQSDVDPMISISPEEDYLQMYTSGTTGHPKGVQLTHGNYLEFSRQSLASELFEWEAGEVTMVVMPSFHVAGVNAAIGGLIQGASCLILRDVDPMEILKLIPQYKVNYTVFVPAVIMFLIQTPGVEKVDFSSLKLIFYGASPISEDVLIKAQEILACDFCQVYGLTETSGLGTTLLPEHHDPALDKLRSCGIAADGVEIMIRGEDGSALPANDIGEILFKSKVIMKGYWANSEATEKSIQNDWFHTGDAGYLDEEGFLFIRDRVKDMIVSGGENVYPAEVENALHKHPAIADAAVIGIPDEKWGEAVKAIVVKVPDQEVTEEEIITFAREQIAAYKVPKSVDFIDVLPRNPSGKILKRELRAPFWEGKERQVN